MDFVLPINFYSKGTAIECISHSFIDNVKGMSISSVTVALGKLIVRNTPPFI